MRLGIFGGTFNPIHYGHLRAAEEVRYKINLDRVIFIPSGNPPLKSSELSDAAHRYAMTKLATDLNVNFVVSDIELRQTGKAYTVNTLERLFEIYAGDELFFVLGIDAFLDIPNWRQPDRLIGMIDFIILTRPGFDLKDIIKSPFISGRIKTDRIVGETITLKGGRKAIIVDIRPLDISSTEIRELAREDKSIKYILPEAVEKYIYTHNLYKS
ncbi:MAG: nicotinic acid mononucleotide adenylyltransferase [Thermodesulfovibrio sp.]|nr:nicotinic acid mononucleotide adenylyltransferase [Thermodesulfovibrio sp.]